MQKSTLQLRVTNTYSEKDVTLTELVQEWLKENYFLESNNDKIEIKYNGINK